MTNAEVFDRSMRSEGGRLNRDPFPEEVRQLFSIIDQNARTAIESAKSFLPRLPDIYFDLVRNAQVNAWAFKEDGRYFVGISTGAIYMLQVVFFRMLAHPEVFQQVGDASLEDAARARLDQLVPDADKMYRAGMVPVAPKSEVVPIRWTVFIAS